MSHAELAKIIDDAFEQRDGIGPSTKGAVREAVEAARWLVARARDRSIPFGEMGIVYRTGDQYERLLVLEQERRRKRDKLELLLPTIADALDVHQRGFLLGKRTGHGAGIGGAGRLGDRELGAQPDEFAIDDANVGQQLLGFVGECVEGIVLAVDLDRALRL